MIDLPKFRGDRKVQLFHEWSSCDRFIDKLVLNITGLHDSSVITQYSRTAVCQTFHHFILALSSHLVSTVLILNKFAKLGLSFSSL